MNLAVWVERRGRRRPDDPALADGELVDANLGTFAARVAAAAAGLRHEFSLSRSDRVAIVMHTLGYFADVDPVMSHDRVVHAAPLAHVRG